jgi:hypothetical protein
MAEVVFGLENGSVGFMVVREIQKDLENLFERVSHIKGHKRMYH